LSVEKSISQVYSRSLLYRIKPPFLASAKDGQEGPGGHLGKTGARRITPHGTQSRPHCTKTQETLLQNTAHADGIWQEK